MNNLKKITPESSKPTEPNLKEAEWKDITSYSRNGPQEPHVWSLELLSLKITLLDSHILHKGVWVVSCHELGLDAHELPVSKLEQAKPMALHLCRCRLTLWANDLDLYRATHGVVHFMEHGQTRCQKPGPPGIWTEPDKWDDDWINVTCPKCLMRQ